MGIGHGRGPDVVTPLAWRQTQSRNRNN